MSKGSQDSQFEPSPVEYVECEVEANEIEHNSTRNPSAVYVDAETESPNGEAKRIKVSEWTNIGGRQSSGSSVTKELQDGSKFEGHFSVREEICGDMSSEEIRSTVGEKLFITSPEVEHESQTSTKSDAIHIIHIRDLAKSSNVQNSQDLTSNSKNEAFMTNGDKLSSVSSQGLKLSRQIRQNIRDSVYANRSYSKSSRLDSEQIDSFRSNIKDVKESYEAVSSNNTPSVSLFEMLSADIIITFLL